MSIEIEVMNGDASWPMAQPLFNAIWPPHVVEKLPWGRFTTAYPEWRVLLQAEPEGVVCHVGVQRREVKWNGRKMRAGGIGGVLTHEGFRRRGYASLALNAAIQILKDEGSIDFALLFCEPHNVAFYVGRGWKPFEGEIFCDQPEGRIRYDATAPYVFDIRRAPQRGTIDLCGLPW
jgi:aminoglycoside 2'-N-acetyltransferase I